MTVRIMSQPDKVRAFILWQKEKRTFTSLGLQFGVSRYTIRRAVKEIKVIHDKFLMEDHA